jgi:ribosome maturation factor RimP
MGNEPLERDVESCLESALPGVELLELTVLEPAETLRLVVDHPDGVTHEVCVAVTHAVQAIGLGEKFGIEVWSPGPEPPLRTRDHFARAIGHRVELRVFDAERHRARDHAGTLTQVGDEAVTIAEPAGVREIPFSAIRRARDLEGGREC